MRIKGADLPSDIIANGTFGSPFAPMTATRERSENLLEQLQPLPVGFRSCLEGRPGHVAAGMCETFVEADINRRADRNKNHRNIGRGGFGGDRADRPPDHEQVDVGKQRQDRVFHLVRMGGDKSGLQADVLAVDIAKGGQPLLQSR